MGQAYCWKYSDIKSLTHSGCLTSTAAELSHRRLQVDGWGAADRIEACHRQFAAVDGFDGAARHAEAVRPAGSAAGEDTDGRKIGAAAVRARFTAVVAFGELIEDEEDLHVAEAR